MTHLQITIIIIISSLTDNNIFPFENMFENIGAFHL